MRPVPVRMEKLFEYEIDRNDGHGSAQVSEYADELMAAAAALKQRTRDDA